MKKGQKVFGIRQSDGSWARFDRAASLLLEKAMADLTAGEPGSIVVRDEHDEPHVLSPAAAMVVRMALYAMDARLRPGGCYRERADEVYTVLATTFHEEAVQELRRVFHLGAKRPWLMR
jgi:hypothetical protein